MKSYFKNIRSFIKVNELHCYKWISGISTILLLICLTFSIVDLESSKKLVIALKAIASYASIIVMAFTAFALFLNSKNVSLQRLSIEANIFQNISNRISSLEDQWNSKMEQEEKEDWIARFFNAIEYFCFFANRDKLPAEMKIYYKSGIKDYVKRLKEPRYADLLASFQKKEKDQYCELRQYYKREFSEEFPF